MIVVAFIVAVLGYAVALDLGAPDWLAQMASILLFFCTLPFALIFGGIDRAERRSERKAQALEKMASSRKTAGKPIPPTGGSGTVARPTYQDDRVVIIDNRQVNIYHGDKPKEN